MVSDKHKEHIPVLENRMDDVVVSVEPQTKLKEEDALSSVSEAPSVEHYNISVSLNKCTDLTITKSML